MNQEKQKKLNALKKEKKKSKAAFALFAKNAMIGKLDVYCTSCYSFIGKDSKLSFTFLCVLVMCCCIFAFV